MPNRYRIHLPFLKLSFSTCFVFSCLFALLYTQYALDSVISYCVFLSAFLVSGVVVFDALCHHTVNSKPLLILLAFLVYIFLLQYSLNKWQHTHFLSIILCTAAFFFTYVNNTRQLHNSLGFCGLLSLVIIMGSIIVKNFYSTGYTLAYAAYDFNAIALVATCFFPFVFIYITDRNIKSYWKIAVIGIYVFCILFSESRLSILLLCVQILSFYWANRKRLRKLSIHLIALACVVVIIALLVHLFVQKQASSTGRLFIWKLTLGHLFQHNWLFGNGLGSFASQFTEWQAAFFKQNGSKHIYAKYAGDTQFAFNEYLQMLYEIGIVGTVLFVVVIGWPVAVLITRRKGNTIPLSVWLSFGSIVIAGMATYALHILPLCFLLFLLTGLLYKAADETKASSTSARTIYAILYLIGVSILCYQTIGPRYWNRAKNNIDNRPLYGFQQYHKAYSYLNINSNFLVEYALQLSKQGFYKESNKVLQQCLQEYNSSDVHLLRGLNYESLEDFSKARESYSHAGNIFPSKIFPVFAIGNTYLKQGQQDSAIHYFKMAATMPIKINNPTTRALKNKAGVLLDSLSFQ